MTEREVLVAARALVASGWCRFASAEDAACLPVGSLDPEARSWCTLGALYRAAGTTRSDGYTGAYAALRLVMRRSPDDFNDAPGRTQDEVLAAFDAAISAVAS